MKSYWNVQVALHLIIKKKKLWKRTMVADGQACESEKVNVVYGP